jgi:hypothetical protein
MVELNRGNPRYVYPIAQYKNQWRNFAKLGLRMMISDTKILLADDDEKVDLEEIVDKNLEYKCSPELVERCTKRIFPMLKLAIKENLM